MSSGENIRGIWPMEDLVKKVGDAGGCTVLLKDSVACNGSFMLHYLLRKLLSDTSTRVVLLALSEPFTHYNRIARKQGCNLQGWRDKGRFVLLGLNPDVFEFSRRSWNRTRQLKGRGGGSDEATSKELLGVSVANPLAALYFRIRDVAKSLLVVEHSRAVGEQTCIIIDDVSVLDVLAGGSPDSVIDFVHYCQALSCGKQRCSVVLLTHQDIYEEPVDSYTGLELEFASDTVINVEPLSTGLAADVHGQLTMLHRIDHSLEHESPIAARLQKFQFRILENTVQFFLPGQP